MNATELLELISQIWCTTDDLMKLSGLGYVKASNLKKEIRDELLSKGIYLSKGKIPMPEVVKRYNIDIDHYKKIVEYELKERMVKTMLYHCFDFFIFYVIFKLYKCEYGLIN